MDDKASMARQERPGDSEVILARDERPRVWQGKLFEAVLASELRRGELASARSSAVKRLGDVLCEFALQYIGVIPDDLMSRLGIAPHHGPDSAYDLAEKFCRILEEELSARGLPEPMLVLRMTPTRDSPH